MKILLLTHSFNHLSQRIFVQLKEQGHEVSVEFDIHDSVTREAIALFEPDLIIAPYLKRKIPEDIYTNHLVLIVHPGIEGDRGPSSLDWAILEGKREWGVTVLGASAELDAGDIWATAKFPMRTAPKSSLYREEVATAACEAITRAIARYASGDFRPRPLDYSNPDVKGEFKPLMKQRDRRIDWQTDSSEEVVRKINCADSFPGVLSSIQGMDVFLYNAAEEANVSGPAGEVIGRRFGAICIGTVDGAVWVGHLRRKSEDKGESQQAFIKLPAETVLGDRLEAVPFLSMPDVSTTGNESDTGYDIDYREEAGVGYLHFNFLNGAMSTKQCERLLVAYKEAAAGSAKVLVLMGGQEFWSNGINLCTIEGAERPPEESWSNINALNDFVEAVINTTSKIVIAAMQGPAAAGGAFMALAADRIYCRSSTILNPHYKNMGNLYGSEYWTYLVPRRLSYSQQERLAELRQPIGAEKARDMGLCDEVFGESRPDFLAQVKQRAEVIASSAHYHQQILDKKARRERDEEVMPLALYRQKELEKMRLNFFGCDPSYHVARYNFVYRVPLSRTPRHLALHRHSLPPAANI